MIYMVHQKRDSHWRKTLCKFLASHPIACQFLMCNIAFLFLRCPGDQRSNLAFNLLLLLAPPRLDKFRVKEYADNSTTFCNGANHFVIQVAPDVCDGAAPRVSGNHWLAGCIDYV